MENVDLTTTSFVKYLSTLSFIYEDIIFILCLLSTR